MIKFCKTCNFDTDRNKSGGCKACYKASGIAFRARNNGNYLSVSFCQSCNLITNRGIDGRCKPCQNYYNAQRRAKILLNEQLLFQRAEYQRKYRLDNAKNISFVKKLHRIATAKQISEYGKLYYKNNLEMVSNNVKRWQKNNPQLTKMYGQNTRAKRKSAGGKLSKGLAEKLLILQKNRCACCSKQLNGKYHLDHIMPLSKGGSNSDDNIQLLLPLCNMRKGAKNPDEYMKEKGFLI